jgi:peptide/nickel transport system substrate-binding protein
MRVRFFGKTIALLGVLLVVAAACSSNKTTTPGGAASPTAVPQGGSAVLGAEQWPECINPITQCSAATWYWYTVGENLLPYAMVLDLKGNFVASPTLVEAPTLENGGISQNPFTLTFKISDKAVWDDGSPITSNDIAFTWKAIMNTSGAYTTTGYDKITSVDTSNPKTAVIKFSDIYVDWPDLFGGVYQGILKQAAFPDADAEKPNLKDEMQDSIPFSGRPWVLKSWSKDQAVFTKNTNYFGDKANLDQVTFVPRIDLTTETNSLLTGEVAAIYPQPPDTSLLDQMAGNPNVKAAGSDGAYFEALWFNHDSAPLDDPMVRQALMYAVDRQAIIDNIIKLNNPNAAVLNCGFVSFPNIGNWCSQSPKPFEQFTYDPDKAKQILTDDGYDCSASPCTKGGKSLVIEYSTVSTNTRRTTTQELLKDKAKAAGIEFKIKNYDAGVLFGDVGPHGKFTMADYATGGSVDPSDTANFGCSNIPTKDNDFGGGNWNHWCNKQADALMQQSDKELDNAKRLDQLSQVYALMAQDFMSLPLYVLPNVGAWRTDQIAGPITDYIPSNLGMFWNMDKWYKVGA